ncbi:MAG TPA: ATP-binding cassette domain-containing protein [Bacteroidia bacterium]|jgi:putative ABC transport system ATP-binding protein|nr:ATP-binding cassette domain-containing protein [Bacteroidia bacterium]
MIELQHITKRFNKGKVNEVLALQDVSFTIPEQEFVVVIGANGSGKTTLLNILSGAEYCTEGNVLISGTDVSRLPEYKRSKWIARVFQDPLKGTASDLSILDNFRLAAIRTTNKKLIIGVNEAFKKKVKDTISILGMGLENKLEQAMGTLSGGQRQALTLLMSVMDDTRILLLDEPTAALDPRSAALILQTADNLIKQYHLTAILITHNLKDANQYGTRLIQMGEGKVIRDLQKADKAALSLHQMYEWFN